MWASTSMRLLDQHAVAGKSALRPRRERADTQPGPRSGSSNPPDRARGGTRPGRPGRPRRESTGRRPTRRRWRASSAREEVAPAWVPGEPAQEVLRPTIAERSWRACGSASRGRRGRRGGWPGEGGQEERQVGDVLDHLEASTRSKRGPRSASPPGWRPRRRSRARSASAWRRATSMSSGEGSMPVTGAQAGQRLGHRGRRPADVERRAGRPGGAGRVGRGRGGRRPGRGYRRRGRGPTVERSHGAGRVPPAPGQGREAARVSRRRPSAIRLSRFLPDLAVAARG